MNIELLSLSYFQVFLVFSLNSVLNLIHKVDRYYFLQKMMRLSSKMKLTKLREKNTNHLHHSTFRFSSLLSLIFFLLIKCVECGYKHEEREWNGRMTTSTLSQSRGGLVATSSGELVFFGGGISSLLPTGKTSDRVDIYNVTSGSWTTSTLSIPRVALAATSSQNLVFFGGGWNGTTVSDRVDIYNTLNGSWSTATLSQPRCCLAATSVRNLVLFGGGFNSTGYSKVVDVFNVTITHGQLQL
jgi:hypothetical protein